MASAVTQPQAVRAQLERILASTPFAGSHRSQRFLRYVVENSLDDAQESLKEYAIAIEVFERNPSYDPSIDATVRVEADGCGSITLTLAGTTRWSSTCPRAATARPSLRARQSKAFQVLTLYQKIFRRLQRRRCRQRLCRSLLPRRSATASRAMCFSGGWC